MKKIALILSILMMLSVVVGLTACGGSRQGYDDTKTLVFVGVAGGGLNVSKWLEPIATEFETEFADYKNGDKVGVDIIINEADYGKSLFGNYDNLDADIYFTEDFFLNDWLKKDYLLDITDVVTGEHSQGKTIESTLNVDQRSYYGQNGKYFCLPYASAYNGFIYDADMWFEKGLYMTKDYDEDKMGESVCITPISPAEATNGQYATLVTQGDSSYYQTVKGEVLSMGPDGVYGTSDDGTPATVEDFFELCGYMVLERNVTPFIYSGANRLEYLNWLLSALSVHFDGQSIQSTYTLDGGNVTIVDKLNADGSYTTKEQAITAETYLESYKSVGKYEALKFVEQMVEETSYISSKYCGTGTVSHLDAQRHFMRGRFQSNINDCFAFLVDGTWWDNEADNAYKALVADGGDKFARENRNFKFLSFPKLTEQQIGDKPTYVNMVSSSAFILNKVDASKIDICKEFFKKCFSERGNASYTSISSIPRPYQYDMTASEYDALSPFGKNIWDTIYKNQNKNLVVFESAKPVYQALGVSEKMTPRFMFRAKVANFNYLYGWGAYEDNYSIKDIFNGVYSYATSVVH